MIQRLFDKAIDSIEDARNLQQDLNVSFLGQIGGNLHLM